MKAPVMRVAWVNPKPPVELPRVKCGVCGKEGSWIEGYSIQVGADMGSYQYFFGVCSDQCDKIVRTNKLVLRTQIELNKAHYAGKKMPAFLSTLIKMWEHEYATAPIR